MSLPSWLAPGSTIKRWLVVYATGLLIVLLGIDYLLVDLYHQARFPDWAAPVIRATTLQFIPRGVRGVLFLLLGIMAIGMALRHLNRVIVSVIERPSGHVAASRTVITVVARHTRLHRGPRVVVVGGGTGMSLLLHGLRDYSRNLSAVVTVADDGGNSGRLRRELHILPPGDFRQCIAALADVEDLMVKLLQYRFKAGSGLQGHCFGNLFIAAMADITGSFEAAVAASSRVLAVQGEILPSTLHDIILAAELTDRSHLHGESQVGTGKAPIDRVFLIPEAPPANPAALAAIRDADIIVLGPGSLYTSVLPNLLVPGIAQAIAGSRAKLKAFICNVATEPGETDGYTACDFVHALERHVGRQLVDIVITNSNDHAHKPDIWKSQVVQPGDIASLAGRVHVVQADVVDGGNALRHDARKLAHLLHWLYRGKARSREWQSGRATSGSDWESVLPRVQANVEKPEDVLKHA